MMHPLLNRRSYLGAYLAVWLPLAALLVFLIKVSGGGGTLEAVVLLVPMAVLYAGACLSTWYVCRATPLKSSGILRVSATHLFESLFLSFVWIQIGRVYARALSSFPLFAGLDARYNRNAATLLVGGVLLYLVNVGFFYVLIAIEASRVAEARVLETSVLARDAELKALKAQVNPHFLFNSLNSISALTSVDPAKAREMCILLAEFLRMTLGLGEKSSIPLAEELSLLHRFLAIEKVRFGSRLQMTEEIQESCKTALIPPLLLQPLVENAVTHGIANLPEGGAIRLTAQASDGRLSIVVENTFDPESTPSRRSGLGLANVRRRLESRYAQEAHMRVTANDGQFQVSLSLPAETQEAPR
jgi:two-component system, LytTR family, sensor histidine kinase AlgZ